MRRKIIALFGGSFNPPHAGHFDMAKYIYNALSVDEVWFLFSLNWQKDKGAYESTRHRMKMGQILADAHYPDMPFMMSDIQDRLGTHITYNVLTALEKRHPDLKFIWVMGADSLQNFHTWENSSDIAENFPMAILSRPGYQRAARESFTALTYAHLETEKAKDLRKTKNGWHFLNNPEIDLSSSAILKKLQQGNSMIDPRFEEVQRYIQRHSLYQARASEEQRIMQEYSYDKK
jgi:nicotinate-nucleotide adenylyltransferase